jgi:hypothetical protein
MPRAAISKGYAMKILPLDTLGTFLISHYGSEHIGSEKSDTQEKSDKGQKTERSERTPVSTPRA